MVSVGCAVGFLGGGGGRLFACRSRSFSSPPYSPPPFVRRVKGGGTVLAKEIAAADGANIIRAREPANDAPAFNAGGGASRRRL